MTRWQRRPGNAVALGPRSKPAVRVIWVWTIGCRGRRIVVRRGRGGADCRTYRDTSGDATPTCSTIVAPAIAPAVDVDIAVDSVAATAIDVGGVEVPAVACHGS